MEQKMSAGKAIFSFVVGGAMGVGTACLVSRIRASRQYAVETARRSREQEALAQIPGTYCAVPEGADICYPE
jgi:hypothetical protein